MDEKTLRMLEFSKVIERLASYAAFSVSEALARGLTPVSDRDEVVRRLALTSEARRLLSRQADMGVGGARSIAPLVDLARHGGVLKAEELLEVKNTLIAARDLTRAFNRQDEAYPHLGKIVACLLPPAGIVDAISQAISDRGEILDQASDKLAVIRRDLKIAHERLYARLERMLNDRDTAPMLQESIITLRNDRYVIPLRAEFKGRIRGLVHDQSSSGATLFIEPLAVVELNNQWHELQLAERDEEQRILADLSLRVGQNAEQLESILAALGRFDLALMCARYADDLDAAEPVLLPPPNEQTRGGALRLRHARHPLLDPQKVVPIDVDLDEQTFAVVITGPNTGGKTVTLKTVGLLCLMAQSGLHIPVQSGSALCLFENIFADIGDEQSIEQSLSTFSGHIKNIVRILKRANQRTLVLFDELGAGTDPQEGAGLARAILVNLVESRVTCLVATHYPELKAFAHTTPGVINASMEFDLRSLRPTYHLNLGLPGRSNALLIAQRLGLPAEILDAARAAINPGDLHADSLLDEIHRQRDASRKAQGAADRARHEAEKMRGELAARLEKIEEEREQILEQARHEAEQELEDLRLELEDARQALRRARQPLDAVKEAEQAAREVEAALHIPVAPRKKAEKKPVPRPLKVGDRVHLRRLHLDARVTALSGDDVEVQAGVLRLRVALEELQRPNQAEEEAPVEVVPKKRAAHSNAPAAIFHPSPGVELDLRGQLAEDALQKLDNHLEQAFLADLPYIRIIHGKGTGRLREVVRRALRQSRYVKNWTTGSEAEGGDGVTVARLDTGSNTTSQE
jgi:DNA mismatch repair protein MutS2